MATRKRSSRHASSRGRWGLLRTLSRLLRLALIFAVLGGLAAGLFILYFSRDLPDVHHVYKTFRRPSLTLYDQNGVLMATYGDTYGEMVSVDDLPPHVSQALLAVEDRRFYEHFGIDVIGIVRAFWTNYKAGGVVQGGSTLTQQLAKNILQSQKLFSVHDRSFKRKIQEAILSIILESKLSKKQILTLYLNRVYFGGGAFGIDAAAVRYFGRPARRISVYEAAVLMGLLKAPSRYSPAQNPEKSADRARQVLTKMVAAGFISPETMETSLLMATPAPEVSNGSSVRYFTDWVVDTLSQHVSPNQDLKITTTLNLELQQLAEKKAAEVMATVGKKWNAEQVALVALSPNGAVRALLGGTNYNLTKFNRTTQALRQPGSAFKFFTFLAALESGLTPSSLVDDTPPVIGTWKPKNYLYTPKGSVSLEEAFSKSVNAVAVRLAMQLGVNRLTEMARRLGVTTKIPANLSIALGTGEVTLLEMTAAFGSVVNDGFRVIPHGILTIKDKAGHTLYQWEDSQELVLQPSIVQEMRRLMGAVVTSGTARTANIGRPALGKTGTTQEYRDVWFVGATPELITGIWTGRDSNTPMTRVPGGMPPTHLWKAFMQDALLGRPLVNFSHPEARAHRTPSADPSPMEGLLGTQANAGSVVHPRPSSPPQEAATGAEAGTEPRDVAKEAPPSLNALFAQVGD